MTTPAGRSAILTLALAGSALAQGEPPAATGIRGPFVAPPVAARAVAVDLRRLPRAARQPPGVVRAVSRRRPEVVLPPDPPSQPPDPVVQRFAGKSRGKSAPSVSFEGASFTGSVPPDPIGDVGPDHYVQMVNTEFSVYDKAGGVLAGPMALGTLWASLAGEGSPCAEDRGDPVVVYDGLADRWLLSQFTGLANASECVAISRGPDPVTDGFYVYELSLPAAPDYPKFGVWGDAYYLGANSIIQAWAYAMDRTRMLAGESASIVAFSVDAVRVHSMLMPADLDGATPPPAGSPGIFYRHVDDLFGGVDRLELFEFDVDFEDPGSSKLTGPTALPTAAFASLCGFSFDCIAQPGTAVGLDSITEWPMWRFAYRNLGSHEALVANHAVDAGGAQAGVRWYELRRAGGGAWAIHQQSTFAPDGDSRWMASIAMDGNGNVAMGYNVSSSTVFPSIRYTGRLAGDPLGTMTLTETTAAAGGGSQTAVHNRWGDYSALSVDPEDDCTFWLTGEYQPETAQTDWRTRIVAFRLPGCGALFADGFESGDTGAWD